jgi:hypothetical protein
VRDIECDAQKVVFNSRYGEYVDVAINEFVRAIAAGGRGRKGHRPRRFPLKRPFSPLEMPISPLRRTIFCDFSSENSGTDVPVRA